MTFQELLDLIGLARLLSTAALVVVLLVARHLISRRILAFEELPSKERRQWLVRLRTSVLLGLLVGLVFIWAEPLRSFSLTLMAFAVAVVIATKEFIACFGGAIFRASAQPFGIGDRIEVKGMRGWVIDQTLLATTLLEIGPGQSSQIQTGRAITLPNSLLLTESVVNETFLDEHVFHLIVVPMKRSDDWRSAQERLLRIATEECAPFVATMTERVEKLAREHGISLPPVEPRVAVRLPEPERVDLIARVPVPAGRRGSIEQRILTRFLEEDAEGAPRSEA